LNIQGRTAKYIELSNQLYGLIVDAFAFATRSTLGYWKSVLNIASRPYASTAIASTIGDNFNRAGELAQLTVGELRSRVQRTADFSEMFLAQVGKLQHAAPETYRDSLKLFVSSVDQVKDASTELSANGFKHRKTPANPVSVTP
jgi:hypothetical protein